MRIRELRPLRVGDALVVEFYLFLNDTPSPQPAPRLRRGRQRNPAHEPRQHARAWRPVRAGNLPGGELRSLGLDERGRLPEASRSRRVPAPAVLGVRLAQRQPGVVHLWSCSGKLGQNFPLIAAAIARLPVNDATLDGKAACLSMTEDRTSTPCARATPDARRSSTTSSASTSRAPQAPGERIALWSLSSGTPEGSFRFTSTVFRRR